MRVGLYARVSTLDKDQDPETQLVALREFVRAQGWGDFPRVRGPRPCARPDPSDGLARATGRRGQEAIQDGGGLQAGPGLSVGQGHARHAGYVGAVGDRFQERARAVRHRDGCGKTAAEPSGGGGRVRAGDDPRACEGGDGQGSATGQADRASQGNGPARLRSSFWSYFGAPKLGRTIETQGGV